MKGGFRERVLARTLLSCAMISLNSKFLVGILSKCVKRAIQKKFGIYDLKFELTDIQLSNENGRIVFKVCINGDLPEKDVAKIANVCMGN